ncbi:MAG: THUMP domain-containing protein [Candidatus Saliniplasma sp.]
MQLYILRYGEIGTKSGNIRRNFVDILLQNIERTFLKYDEEVILEKERGRIYAFTDKDNSYLFSRIFGIVSYSPVIETSSELSDIKQEVKRLASALSGTFAVRARRVGQHDYSSPEAAGEAGSAVLEVNPKLDVDLDEPDEEIFIEIRDDRAYIYREIYKGPGGLPLSSQGKVASFIEDQNDFLATWLMMKRGARPYIFHGSNTDWIDELKMWEPNLKILGEGDIDDFIDFDFPEEIEGLVLGDILHDLSSVEHDLPVFRPLIGFTDARIKEYLEEINFLSGGG